MMGNGVPELTEPCADARAFERFGQVPEALDARAGGQQNLAFVIDHQQISFQMNGGRLGSLAGQIIHGSGLSSLTLNSDRARVTLRIARHTGVFGRLQFRPAFRNGEQIYRLVARF